MKISIEASEQVRNDYTFNVKLNKELSEETLDDMWEYLERETHGIEAAEDIYFKIKDFLIYELGLEEEEFEIEETVDEASYVDVEMENLEEV